jgi:hypothetical protein
LQRLAPFDRFGDRLLAHDVADAMDRLDHRALTGIGSMSFTKLPSIFR